MNLQAINDVFYTHTKNYNIDDKPELLYWNLFKEDLVCYYLYWSKKDNKAEYFLADGTSPNNKRNSDLKYFWDSVNANETFIKKVFIADYTGGALVIGDKYFMYKYQDSGEASVIKIYASKDFDIEHWLSYVKPFEKKEEVICHCILIGNQGTFNTKSITITKNINCDISKHYNDDLPYDSFVNFCKSKDSGIALMYGDPGTGKSTFIKHLIQVTGEEFFLMDSSMLSNINNDNFLNFLAEDCKDGVLVLEDCEKLLLDRDTNYNPILNTLLNISDGLLSDLLGIKFICTFNTDLSNIDKAVLRKGRLKVKYEFGKLSKDKSIVLAKELGHEINESMTLADIYNMEKVDFSERKQNKIGF